MSGRFTISGELWAKTKRGIPLWENTHPRTDERKTVDNRIVMNTTFLVLREYFPSKPRLIP
jgi:hypothetical protein